MYEVEIEALTDGMEASRGPSSAADDALNGWF
jgi:hypothetical protein